MEVDEIKHFCGLDRTVHSVHPHTFDANLLIVEGAFVYIRETSRGDGLLADIQTLR
jgi:hypothetical protein